MREKDEKDLMKEIEERKRDLERREEKLRSFEAKLGKGDVGSLKSLPHGESPHRQQRSSGSHGSPMQPNKRGHNGEFEEVERPKMKELAA